MIDNSEQLTNSQWVIIVYTVVMVVFYVNYYNNHMVA